MQKILTVLLVLSVVLCFSAINLLACKSYTPEVESIPPARNFDIMMSGEKIVLSWEAVPGAESYDISRAGSRLGKYASLKTVTETTFTDNAPKANRYENYYIIAAKDGEKKTVSEALISFDLKLFGPNMKFYDIKYDRMAAIEKEVNQIHDTEMLGSITDEDGRRAEFSSKRYALYFKPGTYKGFEKLRVGFYTHVGGLGKTPAQTKLAGTVETPPHLNNNNATCTFWRSIENLEISGGKFHWAVSQAAPIRRMKVNVPAEFDWGGWSSGGFTGDSSFADNTGSWSQQQWYSRNSHFAIEFYGVNWNKVMQGSTGEVADNNWDSGGCSTKLETTPVIREKPFLYMENGEYKVFVPALRRDAVGISWTETDIGEGTTLDLVQDFYIARADTDTADTINAALAEGKHIFFTPGRYELDKPVQVTNAGTVVLGTGLATLIPGPENRYGALFVDDVDNVTIAGLMFDALYSSAYLLCVGGNSTKTDHSAAPTLLADLFLRVGGYKEENVHVDVAALINSNDVIADHFWVWRADHGQGVGWDRNTSKNGLIVTGDRVTFYGLFLEHFHQYQTIWIGDKGRMYFYQCETPYDPVNQAGYSSHNGTVDGWAAYKVANSVNEHLAVGLGIYAVFNRTGPGRNKSESMFIENAIEVPNKPGVTVQHACIVEISGKDTETVKTGVRSVVNGTGTAVGGEFGRETIVSYNNGVAVADSDKTTGTQPRDEVFAVPVRLLP